MVPKAGEQRGFQVGEIDEDRDLRFTSGNVLARRSHPTAIVCRLGQGKFAKPLERQPHAARHSRDTTRRHAHLDLDQILVHFLPACCRNDDGMNTRFDFLSGYSAGGVTPFEQLQPALANDLAGSGG